MFYFTLFLELPIAPRSVLSPAKPHAFVLRILVMLVFLLKSLQAALKRMVLWETYISNFRSFHSWYLKEPQWEEERYRE